MFPENEANVVMKETPLNPVWETRDNWKRWFKLNLSLFLSILSELFGPGEPDLLGYLQGAKPTGWLVFLVKTAYVHKETLKCAPWRRWPCEKAAWYRKLAARVCCRTLTAFLRNTGCTRFYSSTQLMSEEERHHVYFLNLENFISASMYFSIQGPNRFMKHTVAELSNWFWR